MRGTKLSVLCVDDHHLVRDCVAAIVEHRLGARVTGEGHTLRGCIETFGLTRPDVTLLNLQTRHFDSLQVIRAIRRIDPCAPIVVYAMDETDAVYLAMDAGATAFVRKDATAADLVRAVTKVHGRSQEFLDDIRSQMAARGDVPALTSREVEILELLAQGLRIRAISSALRISDHTVKAHMRSVYEKLDVHGRAEALAEALRRGLVRLPVARPVVVAPERLVTQPQSRPVRASRLAQLTA
jgi:two-component system, NarL family, response regulator